MNCFLYIFESIIRWRQKMSCVTDWYLPELFVWINTEKHFIFANRCTQMANPVSLSSTLALNPNKKNNKKHKQIPEVKLDKQFLVSNYQGFGKFVLE